MEDEPPARDPHPSGPEGPEEGTDPTGERTATPADEDRDTSISDGDDANDDRTPDGTDGPVTDAAGRPVPTGASSSVASEGQDDPRFGATQSDDADAPDATGGGKGKKGKRRRPHPFAHEAPNAAEERLEPVGVAALWILGATLSLIAGLMFNLRYSEFGDEAPAFLLKTLGKLMAFSGVVHDPSPLWEQWTLVPLFAGLALLGFGFFRTTWSKRLTMAGWMLFGFYWGLTAVDLLVSEDQDYVNFAFAMVGVYFFAYLAYQQWLDLLRKSDTQALHFLNVTAFVAAGTYFIIAKITFLRVWLINVVGDHTKWMLGLFGQGDDKGLQFVVDKQDSQGPVTFFYPDKYCSTNRGDKISEHCQSLPPEQQNVATVPEPSGWFSENLLFYTPEGGVEQVVPVSIILACTAIQSIMLFVGLFAGTEADWRKKLKMSIVIGGIIYILNLVRNTGIIWFYGQGHASFWVMHNAIGKGGSLIAMIVIAFAAFRYFPEFLKSLTQVLDLPDRDGPIERALGMGRRRPVAPAAVEG